MIRVSAFFGMKSAIRFAEDGKLWKLSQNLLTVSVGWCEFSK